MRVAVGAFDGVRGAGSIAVPGHGFSSKLPDTHCFPLVLPIAPQCACVGSEDGRYLARGPPPNVEHASSHGHWRGCCPGGAMLPPEGLGTRII